MIDLLSTQSAFVESRYKKRAFIGGFGCGKTTTGAQLAILLALYYPGSRGMIAGVSYVRHVKDVIVPALVQAIPDHPLIKVQKNDRFMEIKLKKGLLIDRGNGKKFVCDKDYTSKILFYGIGRAGDEMAFRSEEFDWAWVDEAIVCNQYSFEFIMTRLNRSRNNPHQLGLFYVTTTPDEPSHWLKGFLDEQGFEIHTMATSENTHLTQEYLDQRQKQFVGAFAQRYLEGQWVTVDKAIFPYNGLQWQTEALPQYNHMLYTVACDPATSKTGDYFTVVALGKLPGEPTIYLMDCFSERGVNIMEQVKVLQDFSNRYHPMSITIETVAYQEALRQLCEGTIPHIKGIKPNADKIIRSMPLSACWCNGNFKICKQVKKSTEDNIKNQFLGFPSGEHDDIVDACAYAYNELVKPRFDSTKSEIIRSKYKRY